MIVKYINFLKIYEYMNIIHEYTIFILTSYSLYTQVMLILIFINIQNLQKVVLSFEKGLNSFPPPDEKIPPMQYF